MKLHGQRDVSRKQCAGEYKGKDMKGRKSVGIGKWYKLWYKRVGDGMGRTQVDEEMGLSSQGEIEKRGLDFTFILQIIQSNCRVKVVDFLVVHGNLGSIRLLSRL